MEVLEGVGLNNVLSSKIKGIARGHGMLGKSSSKIWSESAIAGQPLKLMITKKRSLRQINSYKGRYLNLGWRGLVFSGTYVQTNALRFLRESRLII